MFSLFKPQSHSVDVHRNGAPDVSPTPPDEGVTTTASEHPAINLSDIWHHLAPVVELAGIAVLIAAFGLAAFALQQSTEGLAALFHVPETLASVTAYAVMLAFVGHCALSAAAGTNSLKFWNAVSAGVWLVISLALVATYNVLRLVGIDASSTLPQMTALLAQGGAVVSPELLTLGRLAYAVLIALAMITLAASIFGALGMIRHIEDATHGTLGHVIASAGITIVLIGAAAFSGLHMYEFGVLAGNDIFTAAASSILAELTFITALKRGIHVGKGYYIALATLAIGYALLTNWAAGRVLLYGIGYISTDPLARVAADVYSIAGPLFAVAWGILEWFTAHPQDADTERDDTPFLYRVARNLAALRGGLQAIRDAVGRPTPPRRVQLAKDGSDAPQLAAGGVTDKDGDDMRFLAQPVTPAKS